MPTYEYECKCGKKFTIMKPIAELDRIEKCECGMVAKRLISAPMLNFWYVDFSQMDGEKEAIDAGMYE